MSTFLVNGVEKKLPISWESPLHELIRFAQVNMSSDQALVTSFKVNGLEISAAEEITLGGLRLDALNTVEIETIHPRELAEDTLQTLIPFLSQLEDQNLRTAGATDPQEFSACYTRFIDGLSTFFEAITSVRDILKVTEEEPAGKLVATLTEETGATMRALLSLQEAGRADQLRALLIERMPPQLARWKQDAVPALIRSRDS